MVNSSQKPTIPPDSLKTRTGAGTVVSVGVIDGGEGAIASPGATVEGAGLAAGRIVGLRGAMSPERAAPQAVKIIRRVIAKSKFNFMLESPING
jgi:hypothetical protein